MCIDTLSNIVACNPSGLKKNPSIKNFSGSKKNVNQLERKLVNQKVHHRFTC